MATWENKMDLFDWTELVSVFWRARRIMLYIILIGTLLSVGMSYIMPEYYLSTTVLLPETEKSKLAGIGGLSDLAALAGVAAGDASLARLYPTILESEAVLKDVIYHRYSAERIKSEVNLIEFWEIAEDTEERSYEVALKKLRNDLNITIDPRTSVVTITIETTEPDVSAEVLNAINRELDNFIRTKRITNASEQRKWIDGRLKEVKAELERSEDTLKTFRERNRQVGTSPDLLMRQERLLRNVQISSSLFVELKKQYEIARIEEIKNIPIINVMDAARPAATKNRPKRRVVVLVGFLLSFAIAGSYVVVHHRYGNQIVILFEKIKSGGMGEKGSPT